jgi:hypothetical protein
MYSIYETDKDNLWRFALGKPGLHVLHVIGLNPSTATKDKSDTTISKVSTVASNLGFDGFIMLNLYPVRKTNWRELPIKVDLEAYESNLAFIENSVSSCKSPTIWAAWGQDILGQSYFRDSCLEMFNRLSKFNPTWTHFGTLTKSGHPRHPSRLSYKWKMSQFNVGAYLQSAST